MSIMSRRSFVGSVGRLATGGALLSRDGAPDYPALAGAFDAAKARHDRANGRNLSDRRIAEVIDEYDNAEELLCAAMRGEGRRIVTVGRWTYFDGGPAGFGAGDGSGRVLDRFPARRP
jgi:hypothetical protein